TNHAWRIREGRISWNRGCDETSMPTAHKPWKSREQQEAIAVSVWTDSFLVLLKSKGGGFLSRFRALFHNEPYLELTRIELRHRGHGDVLDAAALVRRAKRRRAASQDHSIPAELHH